MHSAEVVEDMGNVVSLQVCCPTACVIGASVAEAGRSSLHAQEAVSRTVVGFVAGASRQE